MWPARAAIRPVPAYAVVPREAVDGAEAELSEDGDVEEQVDVATREFERLQPALSQWLARALDGVTDDTAQALGRYLGVTVWKAFVDAFASRVKPVDEATIAAVEATFSWDEELRRGAADEVLESDDVVAMGQPHLVAFVREQVEAALEPDEDGEPAEVDLDAVSAAYRAVLIEILALGQTLSPPRGVATELMA